MGKALTGSQKKNCLTAPRAENSGVYRGFEKTERRAGPESPSPWDEGHLVLSLGARTAEPYRETWRSLSATSHPGLKAASATQQEERGDRPAAAQLRASQRKQTPASLSTGFSVVFYCWQQMHILKKKTKTMGRATSPFWCSLQNQSASLDSV